VENDGQGDLAAGVLFLTGQLILFALVNGAVGVLFMWLLSIAFLQDRRD
jgi:hypothetical protein